MNNAVISRLLPKGQCYGQESRWPHERFVAAIRRVLSAVGDRVAAARRAQQTLKELNAMTDHELEDIGIIRSDIPAIIAGTYPGMQRAASNVISYIT